MRNNGGNAKKKISKRNMSVRVLAASLFPFASNVVTIFAGGLTGRLLIAPNELELAMRVLSRTNSLFILISFTAGVLAWLLFMWPCLRWMFSSSEEVPDAVKRRVVSIPLAVSCVGLMGWLTYSPAHIVGALLEGVPLMSWTVMSALLDKVLTGGMSFVLTYYPLEIFTRKFLIPWFFPDGDFSSCRGAWSPSIRTRLFILYFSVTVFPFYILYCAILCLVRKGELTASIAPLTAVFVIFIVIGVVLTYLFARLLHKPLVEMRRAVSAVHSGNFELELPVESNDEVGNLEEAINSMIRGLREKEFMKDTFGKVVDPSVRDYLLTGHIELGGEVQEATVLFCDIRGFTTMSEKMKPARVVEMLNRYFDCFSACIMAEKGIVNRYIGDAIMALFGAPVPLAAHADAAVAAAKNMESALDGLNRDFAALGFPPLDVGIGIHTGPVLVGNIGSSSRMEYTAIGDTVNIASRVEGLCKTLSLNLLITESTASRLGPAFAPQFVATETLRGKEERIAIFKV